MSYGCAMMMIPTWKSSNTSKHAIRVNEPFCWSTRYIRNKLRYRERLRYHTWNHRRTAMNTHSAYSKRCVSIAHFLFKMWGCQTEWEDKLLREWCLATAKWSFVLSFKFVLDFYAFFLFMSFVFLVLNRLFTTFEINFN